MHFDLVWTNRAKKDLRLLDRETALRVIKRLEELCGKEVVFLEKVKGQEFFKQRIGSYRIFIEKLKYSRKLVILNLKHRRNAYKF